MSISRKNAHSSLRYFGIRGIAGTSFSLPIADLLPKRRNAQNRFPLYGFEAILGVFLRYERLSTDRGIATTLLSCSEDGARKRYSIICYTFSFC